MSGISPALHIKKAEAIEALKNQSLGMILGAKVKEKQDSWMSLTVN